MRLYTALSSSLNNYQTDTLWSNKAQVQQSYRGLGRFTFLSFSEPSVRRMPFCMWRYRTFCMADMSHFMTYSTWGRQWRRIRETAASFQARACELTLISGSQSWQKKTVSVKCETRLAENISTKHWSLLFVLSVAFSTNAHKFLHVSQNNTSGQMHMLFSCWWRCRFWFSERLKVL